MSPAQVADKVVEASRREQEARVQLRSPGVNPENLGALAAQWGAQHAEWQRVAALIGVYGWPAYDPEQDIQGRAWAREREERHTGAAGRYAAGQQEHHGARDGLQIEVWLAADPGRRLRAITARTGLQPEQLLAQLADRVRLNDDGTLSIEPFVPF